LTIGGGKNVDEQFNWQVESPVMEEELKILRVI
jgi:hypothetical protein